MPLHGKIVVIRRAGGDGTEFPLTAACMFGRKIDCDIRIQLPQVSKEHCKVEINENKEVILTNLSEVNPTCFNGVPMQQSERLKHGDVFTIIDRSFRFEAPPPPTPKKKRVSTAGKGETLQVLQEHLVTPTERKSIPSDSFLKDGSKIAHSADPTVEATKETVPLAATPGKDTQSPFSELYNMFKQDLDPKSPWKGFGGQNKTPVSRRNSQKPAATPRTDQEASVLEQPKVTPKKASTPTSTPKSEKKQRRSSVGHNVENIEEATRGKDACAPKDKVTVEVTCEPTVKAAVTPTGTPGRKRRSSLSSKSTKDHESKSSATGPEERPQKFTVGEVAEQILNNTPSKSPNRRNSSMASPAPSLATTSPTQAIKRVSTGTTQPASPIATPQQDKPSPRNSPRANAGQRFKAEDVLREIELSAPSVNKDDKPASGKKRKSGGSGPELPAPLPKKKRVSFGGQLSPELFDKRLPPDSPLRRGATPGRRSLGAGICQTPKSLLRRASTIGLIQTLKFGNTIMESPICNSPMKSAKTPSPAKKSPKAKILSPVKAKTPSPAKKTLKAVTPSPAKAKTPSPAKKTPKAVTQSPAKAKTPSPAKKSPKAKTPSPAKAKTPSPAKKTPKAVTPSPAKAKTPSAKKTPKAVTPSPAKAKTSSPAKKTPKARTPSPAKVSTPSPAKTTPKAVIPSPVKKTPKAKTPSSAKASAEAKTPSSRRQSGQVTPNRKSISGSPSPKQQTPARSSSPSDRSFSQTPRVSGRFSISRISTPSPEAVGQEQQNVAETSVVGNTTPQIPLRRKSMKASAKKTPRKSVGRAALDMIRRRSGASRANLKVVSSFADMVKFGKAKPQAQTVVSRINPNSKGRAAKKAAPPKPKTPARNMYGHTSTGHADSPATIVVGKAFRRAAQVACGAPKVVPNLGLLKLDMNMDEDLTGVSDIFRTPASKQQRKSIRKSPVPVPQLDISQMVELSVMKTPEETGEMMVSPMTAAKLCGYNSEAVTRLLQDEQEGSFVDQESHLVPTETKVDLRDELSSSSIALTPIQSINPVSPDVSFLTGVKRVMKTPRQRPEPVEDLRGKLLKTPKQSKAKEGEVSLVGVKELLKTPKQAKSAPVEELTGVKKLLKTPKGPSAAQSASPVVCAAAMRRLVKTPRQKAEAGLSEVALDGVRHLVKTPKQKTKTGLSEEALEGVQHLIKTPKQKVKAGLSEEALEGVRHLVKTPRQRGEPVENFTGLKRLIKTPKQKKEPVATEVDLTGVKELVKTPKTKMEPVKDKFGLRRLMKSPRQKGSAAVEDYEGLTELLQEPEDLATPEIAQMQEKEISPEVPEDSQELDGRREDKENVCPEEEAQISEAKSKEMASLDEQREPQAKRLSSPLKELILERGLEDAEEAMEAMEAQATLEAEKIGQDVSAPVAPVGDLIDPKETATPARGRELEEAVSAPKAVPARTARGGRLAKLAQPEETKSTPRRGRKPKNTSSKPEQVTNHEPEPICAKEETAEPVAAEVIPVQTTDSVGVDQNLPEASLDILPVPSKGRRGKKAAETSDIAVVVATASSSKASRGRVPKSAEEPALKSRRGAKTKQPSIEEAEEKAEKEAKEMAEPSKETIITSEGIEIQEEAVLVAAVAPKATRGRRGQQPKATPVEVETAVAADEPEMESNNSSPVADDILKSEVASARTAITIEEPAKPSATKAVRGRKGKQAAAKETNAEVEPTAEAKEPLVPAVGRVARGRKTKQIAAEVLEETPLDTKTEDQVEPKQCTPPEALQEKPSRVAKTGRGRKGKQAAAQTDEPPEESTVVVEPSDAVPSGKEEKQESQIVVKPVRGRRGKQTAPKEKIMEEEPSESIEPCSSTDEKAQAPPAPAGRGRRARQEPTPVPEEKEVEATTNVSIEPERKPQARTARPSSRRKTPLALEVQTAEEAVPAEVTEKSCVPETTVAVKPGRGKRTKVNAPDTELVEVPETTSTLESAVVEAPPKRGRGRAATKGKTLEKESSVSETEVADGLVKSFNRGGKKSVNWSADLVLTRGIKPQIEEEVKPERKRAKGSEAPSAPESDEATIPATNVKQAAPNGRGAQRGRGAKKTPEPELPVDSPEEPEPTTTKMTGRRGKATLATKKVDPKPSEETEASVEATPAPTSKRGAKRKEASEPATSVEEPAAISAGPSPPKRRRGKAAIALEEPQVSEVPTTTATVKGKRGAAKKVEPKAVAEKSAPSKGAPKAVRGKRKQEPEATQEMPLQAEDATQAKSRSSKGPAGAQKTVEVPAAVPTRRTRRT